MGQHHHLYNNKRWIARRNAQLRAQPLCVMCTTVGRVSLASVADHITQHNGNPHLFWNGPLQSLCSDCHNRWKQQIEKNGTTSQCDVYGAPINRG